MSALKTVPYAGRGNKVDASLLAAVPRADRSFSAFIASLPNLLAAAELRMVIDHVAAAHQRRGVVALLGGHVIKTGLGPLFCELLSRGVITHVAMNGAAAIHDFELAAFGGTSEDVEAGLIDGSFGMVEETGSAMNQATVAAAANDWGFGEGLCNALASTPSLPGAAASILLSCRQHGVGITVHPAIGAEIIHQHPAFDGQALGDVAARDFRRLAGALPSLNDGGAVLNFGSAVMMPEVFLKALTVARNLGGGAPTGFLAADFDMIRHYRPLRNVVQRPTRGGGRGAQITGHHEIMIPLLVWGIISAIEARSAAVGEGES
jgi:hypothetical protein